MTESIKSANAAQLTWRDLPASAFKPTPRNDFAPYHPSASHVPPDYRDGWNACFAEAVRAFEIADEAMFGTLESEGLIRPGQDRGDTFRIPQPHYMGRAAFDEAVDWLKERGYVELGSDADGDFVQVVRRPE